MFFSQKSLSLQFYVHFANSHHQNSLSLHFYVHFANSPHLFTRNMDHYTSRFTPGLHTGNSVMEQYTDISLKLFMYDMLKVESHTCSPEFLSVSRSFSRLAGTDGG